VGQIVSAGWLVLVGDKVIAFYLRKGYARRKAACTEGARVAEAVYSSALTECEEWPK